jgi:hypothetical protein
MSNLNIVFNTQLELFGDRYISREISVPSTAEFKMEIQKRKLMALIFEQLLMFDKIAIKVDRHNHGLFFLINELGINKVEELLEHNILKLILWNPVIVTSTGTIREDKTIDHSTVFGRKPIVAGHYSSEEFNPEKNIDDLLKRFNFHKDRKKIFKKIALKQYELPDPSIALKSEKIVIDAYQNNRLESLGLKFEKEPNHLDHLERMKLWQLGNEVLETSVLAEKRFKSYDNYSYFNLTNESIKHIESALKVSENTSKILQIENVVDIQSLVFENRIPFDRIYSLRYNNMIKEYRKWINSVSSDIDGKQISKEYIDEITNKNRYFESSGGKFLRTIGMFGIGAGVGAAIAGNPGIFAGGAIGKVADFGLAIIDTYILDGILKGWNPRMFVEAIKQEGS